jgi:cytoskeletal protein CcmA (bactofilin family)
VSAGAAPLASGGEVGVRAPRELFDRGPVRREAVRAERWRLDGTAKVLGPIEVGQAQLEGTLVAAAGFTAESVEVRGFLEVGGPMVVRGALRTRGAFLARATVRIGEGELHGSVRLDAGIEAAHRLAVRGTLRASSLQAAELRLEGLADVPGTIRANDFEAALEGHARIGAVEAHEVRLRGHRENLLDWALLRRADLTVGRIEADRVELVAADVEFVRSPAIVLGPAAHVHRLEGSVVRAHPTSRVGPESRGTLPEGLRR